MRAARHKTGTIVFDKRRGTWNFLQWVDGKRKSKVIGTLREFPTKGAAWRVAQALPSPSPVIREQTSPTMADLIARYKTEKMPTRKCTARTYGSWLDNHILPAWGNAHVGEMQPRPVELWLRELSLAPKSKAHIRNLLHTLLDFAMWSDSVPIARNPMSLIVVKGASKRLRRPRNLTVEQFQKLHKELKEPFGLMAMLCVCFGLRISECLGLRWSDVDWLGAMLNIARGIVEQNEDDVETDSSCKVMAIASELLEPLKAWKQSSLFHSEGDWMFASPFKLGRLPYSYSGFRDELDRAGKACGIGHVSTHAFRHTYRSWLDAVGTSIAVQQKCMRHADIRTTMNIYGGVVTDEMAEAAAKVAGMAFKSANGLQADCGTS
jgi:integrase